MSATRTHKRSGKEAAIREYRKVSRLHDKRPSRAGEKIAGWFSQYSATYPDYREPGTHGGHRGEYHSPERRRELRQDLRMAEKEGARNEAAQIAAELDHLKLDSRTPAGLPNVRRRKGFLQWFR